MKFNFIFALAFFPMSIGKKSKKIMEEIEEFNHEIEELKEFEAKAMEELELLKSHLS